MQKPIRVSILGLEYPLRVSEEAEASTLRAAALVDSRMQEFKSLHPNQSNMVNAVMTALAFADELRTTQKTSEEMISQIDVLDRELERGLLSR